MFVSVSALMVSGIRIRASVKQSLLSASGKDCCLASGGEVRFRALKASEDLKKRAGKEGTLAELEGLLSQAG
jgi:hypothetical protein